MNEPKHVIELDDYEVANLREALTAINHEGGRSPLGALNTGDWVLQIRHKLPVVEHPPNKTAKAAADLANNWI